MNDLAKLRKAQVLEKSRKLQETIEKARALKDKGYSNAAIADRMGISESSVRAVLKGKS